MNNKANTRSRIPANPVKGMKANSSKEMSTRIPRLALARGPPKRSSLSPTPGVTENKKCHQINKQQNTDHVQSVQAKDNEMNIAARTYEAECETRSEPVLAVLRSATPPKPKGLSVGAGEDPGTLSPASSARILPDGLEPRHLGELLTQIKVGDTRNAMAEGISQLNKDADVNTIEKLRAIGTTYHDICSMAVDTFFDVLKNIYGNLEDWQNCPVLVTFIQTDAKLLQSRMLENNNNFNSALAALESNHFTKIQAENNEVMQKNEEKLNHLKKENDNLRSSLDSIEKKLQDYKMKYEETSKSLQTEREIRSKLQTDKNLADVEIKKKSLAEQQKCEKLQRKIDNLEMDRKCKDEIYEKSLQDYQSKLNTSTDLNACLKREKNQLESRMDELTNEKAKLSAYVKEMSSHTVTDKEKLVKEESRRKEIMIELDALKRKELGNKERIKELQETVKLKKENEGRLSSQLSAVKEEKCSTERKLLSQQQRISELEKEKADALAEREEVSNKLLAGKEGLIHTLQDEITTLKKEVDSGKEYCGQLETKIKLMQEIQAKDTSKQQLEIFSRERHSLEIALKESYEYNARVEQELEDMKQQVEKMDRLIHEKDGLLKVRNDLITILQNSETVQQKELDKAVGEMETYRKHYQKMQAELREKDGHLKVLLKELNRMESVLEKAKTEFEVLEKHHNDQRARLEARIAELEFTQRKGCEKMDMLSCVGIHSRKYTHNTKLKHKERFTTTNKLQQNSFGSDIVHIPQISNNMPLKHTPKQINNYNCTPVTLITHADTVVIDTVNYVDSKRDASKKSKYTCQNHCLSGVKNLSSKVNHDFVKSHEEHRESECSDKTKEIHVIQTELVESETYIPNTTKNHSSNEIWLVTDRPKHSTWAANAVRDESVKLAAKLIIPVKLVPQCKPPQLNSFSYSYCSQFIDIGSALIHKK